MIDTILFGGTFDPVHNGHIGIASSILYDLGLDLQVVFVPNRKPPHKSFPVASSDERLSMLSLATADHPNMLVDDLELRNPGVSYSIETLRAYRKTYGENFSLTFLLGADAWEGFSSWREHHRFADYANLIVYGRSGDFIFDSRSCDSFGFQYNEDICQISECFRGSSFYSSVRNFQISSSQVRLVAEREEKIDYLVNRKVAEYIRRRDLYR